MTVFDLIEILETKDGALEVYNGESLIEDVLDGGSINATGEILEESEIIDDDGDYEEIVIIK